MHDSLFMAQFHFINVGLHPLLYSNTSPYMGAINKTQHVHTSLIKRGRWQSKSRNLTLIGPLIQPNYAYKSSRAPIQSQLTIDEVIHKLIYILKPFSCINVGQYLISHSFILST